MLLGEVNLPRDAAAADFFGDQGDEVQLLFNFPVMETMYLALARQDARPLAKALEDQRPSRGLPVRELRAQPRRADPGSAHR